MRGELYNYDPRGNILKVSDIASAGSDYLQYSYSGDCLTAISNNDRGVIDESFSFTHDNLGRMISDGLSGLQMAYNHMDLPTKVCRDSTILVNYSYLADGSKASSLKASGEGLVYRGPFTYRRSSDGTLALESVVCAEGRLTSGKALLYVTDHLGSVRAVIDGNTGSALEASDYSAYGLRSDASYPGNTLPIGPGHDFIGDLVPSLPGGDLGIDWGVGSSYVPVVSYRDHFTGQEDQNPDFGIPYSDHGARHYSPALRRWMTPDPLSEKYYGLSPYNYCGDDPVNLMDVSGEDCIATFNHKTNSIVITAEYFYQTPTKQNTTIEESLKQAINFWNSQENCSYTDPESGEVYSIRFDLSLRSTDAVLKYEHNYNTYSVGEVKDGAAGTTEGKRKITVTPKYAVLRPDGKKSTTGAHEIGHTLGMSHTESGIMSKSQDKNRTNDVSQENINEMIQFAQKKNAGSNDSGWLNKLINFLQK